MLTSNDICGLLILEKIVGTVVTWFESRLAVIDYQVYESKLQMMHAPTPTLEVQMPASSEKFCGLLDQKNIWDDSTQILIGNG